MSNFASPEDILLPTSMPVEQALKKPLPSGCYSEKYKEARERWIGFYFNWTDKITEAELHTARDGFDAGAAWCESLQKETKNK